MSEQNIRDKLKQNIIRLKLTENSEQVEQLLDEVETLTNIIIDSFLKQKTCKKQ